jgi:hypothetical protein
MKAKEFLEKINKYSARVKVKVGGSSTTVNTVVFADNSSQARALLQAAYGENSVVSLDKLS